MKKIKLPSEKDLKELKKDDVVWFEHLGGVIKSKFRGKEKDFFGVVIDQPGLDDPVLKDKTDHVIESEDIREIWLH